MKLLTTSLNWINSASFQHLGGYSTGIFQPAAYRSYKTIEPSLPQALHSKKLTLDQGIFFYLHQSANGISISFNV